MSLTSCLKKAGGKINAKNRASVLNLARQHRASGMDADAAALRAIDETISSLMSELVAAEKPVAPAAAPEQNAPEPNSTVATPPQGEGSQQASATPPAAPSAQAPSAEITSGKAEARGEQGKPAETAPTPSAEAPPVKTAGKPPTAEKIDDFGEKLEGARKDYAALLKDAMEQDVATVPLSKSWPEPDYSKLLASGADAWTVAFVHAARDSIPTKPQQSWKVKRWAQDVGTLRNFAEKLIAGDWKRDAVEPFVGPTGSLKNLAGVIELYQRLGHEQSLKGIEVAVGSYSVYKGEHFDHAKTIWTVSRAAKATAFSNWPSILAEGPTREAAVNAFVEKVKADPALTESAKKTPSFDLWRENGKINVGKKIGRQYVSLKKFDDVKTAREYRSTHLEELTAALERYKSTPMERRDENQPRVGEDHRMGARVTPEVFGEAFGFRGVQFGNYVEQSRRQQDLNDAYDSLMDLAAVLGVPPRALSLDGQLGLAFGARGRGGKGAPAAHFESGRVVINLTKESGAGSLAHEWFHAVDNYFAKLEGGGKGGFVTGGAANAKVRPEMMAAFKKLEAAIRSTGMLKRSITLDDRKSKPYWATPPEMAARAFESYVIARLQDQNASNDYLANIVGEDFWKAQEALFGRENADTYPYPTDAEMVKIREGFDNFLHTLETKPTDKGVALYALGLQQSTPGGMSLAQVREKLAEIKGMPVPRAQAIADSITKDWKAGFPVRVVPTASDLPGGNHPANVRGLYKDGTGYIVASAVKTRQDVGRIIAHEVIQHHGLRTLLGEDGWKRLMLQVQAAANAGNKEFAAAREWVREVYRRPDGSPMLREGGTLEADELAARLIERSVDEQGNMRPGLQWLKWVWAKIAGALRAAGLDIPFTTAELHGIWVESRRALEQGTRERLQQQPAMAAQEARGSDNATMSNKAVGEAFKRMVTEAEDELVEVLFNWEDVRLNDNKDGLISYPGRDAEFSRGRDGGRVPVSKRAFFEWLASDAPLDPKKFDQNREWRDEIEKLRQIVQGTSGRAAQPAREFGPRGRSQVDDAMDRFQRKLAESGKQHAPLALPYGDGWSVVVDGHVVGRYARESDARDALHSVDAEFWRGEIANGNAPLWTPPQEPMYALSDDQLVGNTGRSYTPEQERAMRNVGFVKDPVPLKEKLRDLWKNAGKLMAQGLVDQFAPIKDISREAYGLLRLSKGASGAFEVMLHGGQLRLVDGVYDYNEKKAGGVIQRLLVPLQGEHHDFFRWVAANRAEQLMAQDREHLFSADDIRALKTLADGELAFDYTLQHGARAGQTTRSRAEAYGDSLATFNEFNKNTLDLAQQSGLIDGESRALWEKEFYVPFYRIADEGDGGIRGMNIKSGVVRQQAFKQLKGGAQHLNADLLENTLMNWAHLLDAAAKNRAAKATLEAMIPMGAAIEAREADARGMAKAVGKRNNVVWFMDEGRQRHFVVDDPYLLASISALEYAGFNSPIMKAMGTFKHALTVGVTASPFFKVRNLIRDSIQAIGTGPLSYNMAANLAQGWAATAPGSERYFRLMAGGGTIHFGTMMEGSESKRVQALVEAGVDRATILDSADKVQAFYRKTVEPLITAYNELGNRGEAVNRAALYEQLRRQGVGHAEASLQARDLMDFSMQGSFTTVRFLTQVVPFMNARIQGLWKLGRAAAEDPARFSAVLGATAMLSIGLLAAYSDDEDWKKREDFDRNNWWWFKAGGVAYRIPKPFEVGAIATLAERTWELAFNSEMTGQRFRDQVISLMGDNLSMNPIPQVVKPVLDVYANKDSFTNRPIETMGMEKLQPQYRYRESTTMAARGLSTALNAGARLVGAEAPSPVQIDHLVQGYFSWLGSMIVSAGDVIARPATDQPQRPQPDYWKVLSGSMVSSLQDAPSRYVSAAYTQAKQLEEVYGTWRSLLREGKVAEAQAFREDYTQELVRFRQVEAVRRAVTHLNQLRQKVEQGDGTPEQKRERVRELNDQADRVARRLAPTS